MITVIGIFKEFNLAEDASLYLLANDFKDEDIDLHLADKGERVSDFFNHLFENKTEADAHIAAAQNGAILTIHAQSIREAQEAADALNNYGALDVSIPGDKKTLSKIVEQAVNPGVRLRG